MPTNTLVDPPTVAFTSPPVGPTDPGDSAPRVLILTPACFYREMLRNLVSATLIAAVVTVAGCVADAVRCLGESPIDLLVTDVAVAGGDVLDLLPEWTQRDRRVAHVLVSSRHTGAHILELLRSYPVSGFFDDSVDSPENLRRALTEIRSGGFYWTPSVAAKVSSGPKADRVWPTLTHTERVVLATIGAGADNKEAAVALDLSVDSIRTVREALHRKLQVQTRSELMQASAAFGCVIFTESGTVIRPGYGTLVSNYQTYARRRRS